MIRSICYGLLFIACIISVAMSVSDFRNANLSLTYLSRFDIENKSVGLTEPSGLALSHDGKALWTVSDKTQKIFQLNLQGEFQASESFEIADKGLEGIVLDPTGRFLFVVKEDENKILRFDISTRQIAGSRALSEMTGYDKIATYLANSPPNKGLEGITWNTDTGTLFVMKEGVPGLLIEVSPDLAAIRNHTLLNDENGFVDKEAVDDKLDFSGICYDGNRKRFWIVSDKGQRLFLYDPEKNEVAQSFTLGYGLAGDYQEIKKAEGVAIDPDSNRIYVVSDKEARLYVFDIRD